MKYLVLCISFFLPFIISASNNFSDLDTICSNSAEWSVGHETIILPHIDKKITKAEGYVKYDGHLYMDANTFTDNYRFLGAYFLRYDCLSQKTERLSWLLKKNLINELGFIGYNENTNLIIVYHAWGWWRWDGVWIYDIEKQRLRTIDYRKVRLPNWKKVRISPDYLTYNGESITLELRYYTGNYNYENFGNPDRITYKF